MNCTICGEPVVLVPSAKQRADRYGGQPSDYTNLFTEHAQCTVDKRMNESIALMRRITGR